MKRKLVTIASLLMSVGLLAGCASRNNVQKVEAIDDWKIDVRSDDVKHEIAYGQSGKIFLELESDVWKSSGSQIALCFIYGKNKVWGDLISLSTSSKYVEYSFYDLTSTPTTCIAFCFTSDVYYDIDLHILLHDDYYTDSWIWSDYDGSSPDSCIIAKTQNISFSSIITLGGYSSGTWATSSSTNLFQQYDLKIDPTDKWDYPVESYFGWIMVDRNDNIALFIDVELDASTYCFVNWSYNDYKAHPSIANNFSLSTSEFESIHNQYAGSYTFYFNYTSHKIYITNPAIEAADEYGEYFLGQTDGYCSSTIASGVQTALKTGYDNLANVATGAQEAFAGAEIIRGKGQTYSCPASEAISRYVNMMEDKDYTDFLGLGWESIHSSPLNTLTNRSSGAVAVIIIAATVSITALGIVLLLKKKKHN